MIDTTRDVALNQTIDTMNKERQEHDCYYYCYTLSLTCNNTRQQFNKVGPPHNAKQKKRE